MTAAPKLFSRLTPGLKIVGDNGAPTRAFTLYDQRRCEALEQQIAALRSAVDAITAAQDAADLANSAAAAAQTAANTADAAATSVTANSSLANSFVSNFTAPLVSAASTGIVTIANHDRVYGNGTTVHVTGGTVATGQAAGTNVYIFYVQPSRLGGAVTYQYSTVATASAQINDVHSVGGATIPASGSVDGGFARPPGYSGVEP